MPPSVPFVGDYYEILGVGRDAGVDEIKRAFRRLARECHPDVAGDDPGAAQRFTQVRRAYETLVDPSSRARYDQAGTRRQGRRATWRPPGGFEFGGEGKKAAAAAGGRSDLDLEDIFNDFGGKEDFGFGRGTAGAAGSGGRGGFQHSKVNVGGSGRKKAPQPGRDIALAVDVPAAVARRGGTVTVHYPRLVRSDDGSALVRTDEIHLLRIPPGTVHGDTLRVERMGDAGTDGGPYGDLVCDIRQTGAAAPEPPASDPPPDGPADTPEATTQVVRIGVVEALLGARITVPTPSGPVRLTVPPGTSSGRRLRLRGRAADGGDLVVELSIVVPRELDAESRALIERFAELNQENPRDED